MHTEDVIITMATHSDYLVLGMLPLKTTQDPVNTQTNVYFAMGNGPNQGQMRFHPNPRQQTRNLYFFLTGSEDGGRRGEKGVGFSTTERAERLAITGHVPS